VFFGWLRRRLCSDVSFLHADGWAGDMLESMANSPARILLQPLGICEELPSRGDVLLVEGHEVRGLSADHPARVRYERSMAQRAGQGGEAGPAEVSGQDPDDVSITHVPAKVDVRVATPVESAMPRMLVVPSRPLEMGMCGAPLLDAFGDVAGMVESTLAASHGKLSGSGVCVTGQRLSSLALLVQARQRAASVQALASPSDSRSHLSGWGAGAGTALNPHGGRSVGQGLMPVLPDGAVTEEMRIHGEEAAMELERGPVGAGVLGTTFARLAREVFTDLAQPATEACNLARDAVLSSGGSRLVAAEAGGRAARWWLERGGSAEEAASRALEGRELRERATQAPVSRWGLGSEQTARLSLLLGHDWRFTAGASIAREVAHSAALAAPYADGALAEDGDSLPLAHQVALAARSEGLLASWMYRMRDVDSEAAWETIGVEPLADEGQLHLPMGVDGGAAPSEPVESGELATPPPPPARNTHFPEVVPPSQDAPKLMQQRRRSRRAVQMQYPGSVGER
jgi:hypothetical protein